MKKEDLIWLAGIIDGEGYLGMIWHKREYGSHFQIQPQIIIGLTDKKAIEIIDKIFPATLYEREEKGNQKKSWVYQLRKREKILELLRIIKPYLRIKIQQADLLIEFCKNRKHHKGYSEREKEIYNQLRILNKRGIQ